MDLDVVKFDVIGSVKMLVDMIVGIAVIVAYDVASDDMSDVGVVANMDEVSVSVVSTVFVFNDAVTVAAIASVAVADVVTAVMVDIGGIEINNGLSIDIAEKADELELDSTAAVEAQFAEMIGITELLLLCGFIIIILAVLVVVVAEIDAIEIVVFVFVVVVAVVKEEEEVAAVIVASVINCIVDVVTLLVVVMAVIALAVEIVDIITVVAVAVVDGKVATGVDMLLKVVVATVALEVVVNAGFAEIAIV